MRRLPLLLMMLMLVEVIVFGLLEGTSLRNAGNPLLYFGYWLLRALTQSAPMILMALAMRLTSRGGGADVSLPAVGLAAVAVMALFPAGPAFWYTALPTGAAVAVALAMVSFMLVKRFGAALVVTAIFAAALRMLLAPETWIFRTALGNPPFLLVPGYEYLGEYAGASVTIAAAAAVVALTTAMRSGAGPWRPGFALAALIALTAAVVYTAQDRSLSPTALLGVEVQALVAVLVGLTAGTSVRSTLVCLLAAADIGIFALGMRDIGELHLSADASRAVVYGVLVALAAVLMHRKQTGLTVRG